MDLITHLYKSPLLLLVVGVFSGCGISPNLSSSLESDELYLSTTEEFITDAEYLAFASKDLETLDTDEEYYEYNFYNDNYNSSFNNPYYNPYSNPYSNPYNNPFSNNFNQIGGLGLSSYFNPYGAGNYGGYGGYNPYSYGNYYGGYNPYGYNGYGYNGGFGGFGGSDVFYNTSSVLVGPRTPILTNTLLNSNYSGGRLLTNRNQSAEIQNDSSGNSGNVSTKFETKTRGISNESGTQGQTNYRNNRNNHSNSLTRGSSPGRGSNSNSNNSSTRSSSSRPSNSSGRSGGRP
ncbi:MAG: hypothetical protein COA49_06920 [Bacteroidetes bacterium]|nr:MAG: hypothetical protein COA49_06920 [Bacteroidota bacterium]